MTSEEFIDRCKCEVRDYYNKHADVTDQQKICDYNVYVVWYCKTLQNHKALLSTKVPDGMYYEITYNGDKDEMYLDAYKKWENVVIPCDCDWKLAFTHGGAK